MNDIYAEELLKQNERIIALLVEINAGLKYLTEVVPDHVEVNGRRVWPVVNWGQH